MSGVIDSSLSQFSGLLYLHVPVVATVHHTVGVGGTRAHTENVVSQATTISVHIVQAGALGARKVTLMTAELTKPCRHSHLQQSEKLGEENDVVF